MVIGNSEKSAEGAESAEFYSCNSCDVKCFNNNEIDIYTLTMITNDNDYGKKSAEGADDVDGFKQFVCIDCEFVCYKQSNYNRHISTNKHKKMIMKKIKNSKKIQHQQSAIITKSCSNCNKQYSHPSGLSRHKKTCMITKPVCNKNSHDTTTEPDTNIDSDIHYCSDSYIIDETSQNIVIHKSLLGNDNGNGNGNGNSDASLEHQKTIKDLTEENREIKKQMNMMLQMMATNSQFQAHILELMKTSQPQIANEPHPPLQPPTGTLSNNFETNGDHNTFNNTNNSNNNTFNMNMFLNEKCKDAMNMKDFVNSIQLNMTDMENMNRLGYVEGMSNIFIDNLQKTDLYKRPVHCSDVKRETLYVKENNLWERDGPDHAKMTNAVLAVEHKNVVLVNEWAKANPQCLNSNTRENNKYIKMSKIVTDGEKEGNIDRVIRKVAKSVAIEKDTPTIKNT